MNEKTNYGKIIAITLAVITSACSIAFVIYRLFRNIITFCNTYRVPEDEVCELDIEEIEESLAEEAAEQSEDEPTPTEDSAE